MATVSYDETENLVILAFASRRDTILLLPDDADRLWRALSDMAKHADDFMAGQKAAGKLIVPREQVAQIFNLSIGMTDREIALVLDQTVDRVPLPPPVAVELARRIKIATETFRNRVLVMSANPQHKVFGRRLVAV